MLKIIQSLLLALVLLFTFTARELYAYGIFSDDFNYKDDTKWSFVSNGGNIDFANGILNLSSNTFHFPYITNSVGKNLSVSGNEVIEFKFNYIKTDYMGNGVGVGYTGANGYPYFQFSIWNDLTNGPVLQYQDKDVSSNGLCNYTEGLKKISLNRQT